MKIPRIILLSASVFLFAAAFCHAGETVSRISVEGNFLMPDEEVIKDSGLMAGEPFSSEDVRNAVRKLYTAGYIEDVAVERHEINGEIELVLRIEERPVIKSVSFEGNSAYGDRRLLDAAGLSEGAFLSIREVEKASGRIISLYREAGFAGVSVSEEIEEVPDERGKDVVFRIEEGRAVRRVRIEFAGNTVFSDRELRKAMHTGRRGLFRAHPFRRETLAEDLERLRLLYHGRGYIDAEPVLEELVIDEERRMAFVSIDVSEGALYTVRDISVPEEYAGLPELSEGAPFSPEGLESDVRRVFEHLYADGLLYADVRAERRIDREERKVDVLFLVREGPPVYVERIKISGNIRTRDDVIRRELRIAPGDRFDIAQIRESQRRIRNLGRRQPFFERVTFEIEDGTAFDRKDLHFKVVEGKTGSLLFGVGYSSDDKFVGFIEAHVDNFDIMNPPTFMGAGQDLSVKAEIGSEKRDYTVSFTEPWLFHVPLSFGIDAYDRLREWADYDEGRAGGRLRLGYPLGDRTRASLGYKFEDVDISNLAEDISPDIRREEGVNTLSTLSLGLTRDTRDSFFDPRSGTRSSFTTELAGGLLGGDRDFRKYTARTSVYFPAWFGGALNFRLEGGYVSAFGDTDIVPVYERFYLGGADTVRGYPFRDIGPKDEKGRPVGGDVRFMTNLEYIIPIVDQMNGAVFFDAGNVWSSSSEIDLGDLATGAGIGIRIMSPLGPLRLDYAYGFERKSARLHFTIGWPF